MVTTDEIATVAVFAALEREHRQRLAQAAADIVLRPGEYAAKARPPGMIRSVPKPPE